MAKEKFKPLTLRLTPAILDRIDFVCQVDGQSRQAFIRSAISRALKNWSPPTENEHIWPPCHHCHGKRHDPKLAHGVDF